MSGPRHGRTPSARRPVEPRPFFRLVYRIVCGVPKGTVVTYGQVASLAGRPRAARAVGMALGALRGPLAATVPWHRVIGAGGRCTHVDRFSAAAQRDLLEREGVRFDRRGRVDLRRARWNAPRRPGPPSGRRSRRRPEGLA
jgi:methylated-DNA-protein-cysteine methyltransferase-like protein